MNTRQSDLLLSLKEIQSFLDEHSAKLPGINRSGTRKKLDAAVVELAEAAVIQSGSALAAKSATSKQNILVQQLRDEHMWPIARLAAIELAPLPEISPLAMPKGTQTGERLVADARGMADEAEKFEPTLIEAGLPGDFLEEIRGAADALADWLVMRKQHRAKGGGATEVMTRQVAQARKIIRGLDVCVRKEGKEDTALLGAWKVVKRLRQPGGAAHAASVASAPALTPATGG